MRKIPYSKYWLFGKLKQAEKRLGVVEERLSRYEHFVEVMDGVVSPFGWDDSTTMTKEEEYIYDQWQNYSKQIILGDNDA